jgi:hypothetical protein
MEGNSPPIDARNNRLPHNQSLGLTRLLSLCEVGVAFEAFRFVFRLNSRAAWWLSSQLLGVVTVVREDYD